MFQALAIGFLLLFFAPHPGALAQTPEACRGDLPRIIKNARYEFSTNTRYELQMNYAVAYTCVQNQAPGRLDFDWVVPAHQAAFIGPGHNERPRPVFESMTMTPGCLYYGIDVARRIAITADVGYFWATRAEAALSRLTGMPTAAAQEECRKRYAQLGSPQNQIAASEDTLVTGAIKKKIPQQVKYDSESQFFLTDEDASLLRIHFRVRFEAKDKRAVMKLIYECLDKPVDQAAFDGLSLGILNDDQISASLRLAVQKTTESYRFKKNDEISWSYELHDKAQIGAAQIVLLNKERKVVSAVWVPVIY